MRSIANLKPDTAPTWLDAARHPWGALEPVVDDVHYLRTAIANVYFLGPAAAGDRGWVLVDAGIAGSAGRIREAAESRFGESRPAAIVLTHGHFDHVGALRDLADGWDVPIYAHSRELAYLDGTRSYPRPDTGVGGGSVTAMSFLFPRGPIDVGDRLHALPGDGSVPGVAEWRWLHTPGHTEGHCSLFRERDRVVIAGDAIITTKQESALAVWLQRPELHGPPMYFTPDWVASAESARSIAALLPRVLAAGHGVPLQGEHMQRALQQLAREFEDREVPRHGRYVDGRRNPNPLLLLLGATLLGAGAAALVRRSSRRAARRPPRG